MNGVSQSIAASGLPERVFAVVDLYGKCASVALMDNTCQEARIVSNALSNEATAAARACQGGNSIDNSRQGLWPIFWGHYLGDFGSIFGRFFELAV